MTIDCIDYFLQTMITVNLWQAQMIGVCKQYGLPFHSLRRVDQFIRWSWLVVGCRVLDHYVGVDLNFCFNSVAHFRSTCVGQVGLA